MDDEDDGSDVYDEEEEYEEDDGYVGDDECEVDNGVGGAV